jgi:hypothetical protein
MAGKKSSGSKKPARNQKAKLKDLSSPGQELSEGQAKAVKGGLFKATLWGEGKKVKID